MILIEYVALLNRKQDLLDKIIGNTESQVRFIRKQKMVGLNRLLRTRGQLLETLAILIEQEKEGRQWNDQIEVQKLRRHIQKSQQIVLAASAVAIQTALDEKKKNCRANGWQFENPGASADLYWALVSGSFTWV